MVLQKDLFRTNHLLRGQSLIYQACKEGKMGCVKILRKYGLAFEKRNYVYDKIYESCLDVVIRLNYPNILEIILDSEEYSFEETERILRSNKKYLTYNSKSMIYKYLSRKKCRYRLLMICNC